jgi:filamentous hemagglutinin family protein
MNVAGLRECSRTCVGARWRWDGTLGFFLGLMLFSAGAAAQAIRPDGRTATAVSTSGSVTDVRTATVSNGNAFNSFASFSVPVRTTANLHLPSASANLINIVRDERTNIDGILNAIKDGRIGGNVWFANPHGFVVGATGVVNVGSLSVTTPTQQFVNGFFLSPGNPDQAAVASLLAGTAPRSGTGLVSIQGQVNAIEGVSLSGGLINVGGAVFSGARFVGSAPDFSDVVNVNGISSATNVIAKEGRVTIVADGDVALSGTVAAPGGPGVRGGDISIRAGGSVDLAAGANVSARGNGADSAGGTVYVWADNAASMQAGARMDADAGTSGDGGLVELSAKNLVALNGGQLSAEGRQGGQAGTVLIDPTNLTGSGSDYFSATNYVLTASDSITLDNVVIATRNVAAGDRTRANIDAATSTGNSGSITLQAPGITLKNGTRLLAHAGAGFTAGDITLTATKSDHMAGFRAVDATTRIDIDGATLKGRNISAIATSDAGYDWGGNPAEVAVRAVNDAGFGFLFSGLTGFNIGVAISNAKSEVLVKTGSVIDAQGTGGTRGSVILKADTGSKAEHFKLGLEALTARFSVTGTAMNAGFVWGEANATATVDVASGATVQAGTLEVQALNKATTDLTVIGVSKDTTLNAAAVVNRANVQSSATIAAGATVDVNGSVSVLAHNQNRFGSSATAMALGAGQVGIAVNYTELNTGATAAANANMTAAGLANVKVEALNDTVKNKSSSGTSAGSSFLAAAIIEPVLGLAEAGLNKLLGKVENGPQQMDSTTGAGKPKLGAALTYADNTHNASASIGGAARVTASEDVVVAAKVNDQRLRTHSSASIDGKKDDPHNPGISLGFGGSATIGLFRHNASAFVGDGAKVTARHVGVASSLTMPYEITWAKWEGASTIFSKLNSNLGLADGLLSGWSNATAGGCTGTCLAGSVTFMDFDNASHAYIGRGAEVKIAPGGAATWNATLTGDSTALVGTNNTTIPATRTQAFASPAHVLAHSDVQGVYVAGNMSLLVNGAGGEPGAAAVGGAYNQANFDTSTRAWVSEGAVIEQLSGSPVNVTVEADARTQVTSVAPSAGRGGSYGANIIFSLAKVNDATEASIDDEARVTGARVDVKSEEDTIVWSLAGALNKSESAGVGAGVAINSVTTDTRARIGDNDANNAGGSQLSLTDGKVAATDLSVLARGDGRIESIGVAGAAASSSDPSEPPGQMSQGITKARSALADMVGAKFPSLASKIAPNFGPSPAPQAEPKFGLAVSGSAAVNLVSLGARAYMDGAKVEHPSTGATSLTVSAVNDTDITAATGSGALARANNPSSTWSAGVAGSVSVNLVDNATEALVRNSSVTNAQDVSVIALAGGEQLAVALGLAVNLSADQSKAGSAAGSVSVSQATNTVSARVEDSTLTGQSSGSGRELNVVAYDRLKLGTGGGSLVAGGKGGVGAAVTYSEISDTTEAAISGTTVTNYDDVNVHALTASKIGSGGAMAGGTWADDGFTFGGAFVISDIGNTIKAEIRNSSSITASSKVDVLAADTTGIASLDTVIDNNDGGQPNSSSLDYDGASIGQSAGAGSAITSVAGVVQLGSSNAGVSFAYNKLHNSFTAAIRDSNVSAGTSGTVSVAAESNASMLGIGFGAGIATDKFAGSGSLSLNEIANTVTAEATGAATHKITAGSLAVRAEDKSRTDSFAGNVSGSFGNASVGASVSVNDTGNTARARIEGVEIDAQASTTVRASNDSRIRALAATGGGSPKFAFNGAAAASEITNTTEAYVRNAKADDTGNAVTVTAADSSRIESLAGGAAIAGSKAVGAAVAVNRIGNTTRAYLEGVAAGGSYAFKDLQLRADSNNVIRTLAVGGGAGAGVGVGGSVAVNLVDNNTDAHISGGAKVEAENNVGVIAEGDDRIQMAAGALGVGISAAGAGVAVTVNKIGGTTQAYVSGATTEVNARAKDGARTMTVNAGELAGAGVNLGNGLAISTYNSDPYSLANLRATESVSGLAVNASATHQLETIVANIAGGTYAGVAGTTNVNLVGGETRAYVDAAKINAGANTGAGWGAQQVSIKASDHAYANGFVGTLAVGPLGAGVGLGADTNVFERSTRAYVSRGADVNARDAFTAAATSTQGSSSLAVGGAGGIVGVAGTVSVSKFTSTTEAYVSGSSVDAGSVNVEAEHDSRMFVAAGGVAIGGVAGSGAFAIGVDSSATRAYLSGATVKAQPTGNVNVIADNATEIRNWAVSGAGGGGAAVAGMAVVATTNSITEAYAVNSAIGNPGQKVLDAKLGATDSVVVENRAGAAAVALAGWGVGAGVSVIKVDNTTASYLDNTSVDARDVTVESTGKRDLSAYAATLGVGASGLGLSGTVGVVLVGASLGGGVGSELGATTGAMTDPTLSDGGNILGGVSSSELTALNSSSAIGANGRLTASPNGSTTAAVRGASNVRATRDVKVAATDKDKIGMTTGAVAVGSLAGIGGSVAVVDVRHNLTAGVAQGASLSTTGGGIAVSTEVARLDPAARAVQAFAYQGGGGVVTALGAAVADVGVRNTLLASLDGGASVNVTGGSGAVQVRATDTTDLSAEGRGYNIGAVAAGAAIAKATKTGSTVAVAGDVDPSNGTVASTFGLGSGGLAVSADRSGEVRGYAQAGSGGVLSGSGADASATDTSTVNARIGDSVTVNGSGAPVAVTAGAEPKTFARAEGYNGALLGSVGVSLAAASANPTVSASVGSGSTLTAGSLSVSGTTRVPVASDSARAEAIASGGAALLGVNATSGRAQSTANTSALIGSNATLTIGMGTTVQATGSTRQYASAGGVTVGGLLAIGANIANASSNSTTRADVGDMIKATGASFTADATGTDTNNAQASAGAGGVISGAAAAANTSSTSTTAARTGSGNLSRQIAADSFTVGAKQTTNFNGEVDSVNASLAGGSGAYATHNVNSTVLAEVGDGGRVTAKHVTVKAENISRKDWLGAANGDAARWNVRSGSGGVIDAPAGKSGSRVIHNTTASLGNSADVHITMPAVGDGSFNLDAYNEITGRDKAKLDSGGAIAIAKASSLFYVDQSNATASFGAGSSVTSDLGDIAAGARASIDLDTRASADTYGLAGAPEGNAYSVYNGNNQTILNADAMLLADDGAVFLSGGQSSTGAGTAIAARSKVNLWNKTAIPISTDPDAQANVTSNAAVKLLGTSDVQAAGNISLIADKGATTATASGIGKDIYREAAGAIASGISNLFGGGDVSFDITGGSTFVGGLAQVQVDGSALTGIHRTESLTLDYQLLTAPGCGTPPCVQGGRVLWSLQPTATSGVSFTVDPAVGLAANIQKRINKLRSLMAQYVGDSIAVAAYQSEINFLMFKLVELGLASGTGPGGSVLIDAATGQPIINPGQWNNPSPRQAAERQIVQYQAQVSGTTTAVNTAAGAVNTTASSASVAEGTIIGNASTIDTNAGAIATNNSSIQTSLQSLGNFNASNTTYQQTYTNSNSLVNTNTALRSEINTRALQNSTARTAIDTRRSEVSMLLAQIAATADQTVIDTKQSEIAAKTAEISSLLSAINTRNAEIQSRADSIVANNSAIDANQASLAIAFSDGSSGNNTIVGNITTARGDNTTPRNNVSSAASSITTQTNLFTGTGGYVNVVAAQNTAIATAISDKTNAQTQITSLTASLPTLSTTPANGPIADFVNVNDITVRLGNIRVQGDKLTGAGALSAPGDAQITITNNTPNFLKVGNLTVLSDEGGTIRYNGVLVNGNADINRLNAGGTGAVLATVRTRDSQGAGIAKPAVTITSNYDPNSPAYANLPAPAPDIELNGNINNLRGSVTVRSKAGSIYSNASINAATVDVKADNGDFVQSFVDGFHHVGGDPASTQDFGTPLGAGIIANGSVFISARYLNINSLVQSGIEQWNLTLPASPVLTGPASFYGVSQASLDANLAAFKNGGARFSTFITAAGTVTYDALLNRLQVSKAYADADVGTANWATRTSSLAGLYPLVSDYGNIGSFYDPVNVRYVLDGTQVRGGYIQLFGQILNTSQPFGAGKLRVLDGYGQINVQNPTGLPVVINNLDTGADPTGTGRGVAGRIDITDVQSINTATNTSSVVRSVYTRDYDPATSAASVRLKKEIGTIDGNGTFTVSSTPVDGADPAASGDRRTSYTPQADLRYVWTTGTDNSTVTYWHFSGAQFFGSADLRTAPTGTVVSRSGPFVLNSYRLDNGTYLSKGATLGGAHASGDFGSTSNTFTSGFSQWVKTGEWSNCNWWTLCIAQDYHMTFTETQPTKTITTKSKKADYPIAIEFSGFNQGNVTVNSSSEVLLNGSIRNRAGTTSVASGTGIVQMGDNALISSKDLTLSAGTHVGGPLGANPVKPVQVDVTGVLNASAADGNVVLNQTLGDLRVGSITAAGDTLSGKGRVTLTSDGGILANNASSVIQGHLVDLTSENGAIGSIAAPLSVNVGYTDTPAQRGAYGLKARAAGDIGIETRTWAGNTAGNLLVNTVVSSGGDVRLVAPGRILDNNPSEQIDTRTWNELLNFWDSLALTAGANNDAKRAKAVDAYENGKTQDYRLYWLIRARQANPAVYDTGFAYTVTQAERDQLTAQGLTSEQITQFEANRTAQYHLLHTQVGGFTTAFDAGFDYVASPAERDRILKGSTWTERELGISIAPGLLKNITNTNPVVKSANAQGRNVTLQAGVAIGESQAAVSIPTSVQPRDLTDAQKVALAAAERSDLIITDTQIAVTQRKPVNFEAPLGLSAMIPSGATGHADAGKAFLASMGNGILDTVRAPGEMRIKVRGSIVNETTGTPAVQTGNLILEAANGGIGYVPADGINPAISRPLRTQLANGATTIARAADNVDIAATGDLNVDTVFSRKNAKLTATGSILDAFPTADMNVLADSMTLTAQAGSIGSAANPLDVGVNPTGRITASAETAGQSVYLNGPFTASFNIGSVASGDVARLSADVDMVIDGPVSAPGQVGLIAGGNVQMTPNAAVTAGTIGVLVNAGSLTMVPGATITVGAGTIDIATAGDAVVTGISTLNPTASAIVITSGGRVLDADGENPIVDNLDLSAAAVGAKLTINAQGQIGGNPLDILVWSLDATAATGLVHLDARGDVTVGTVQGAGEVLFSSTGTISGGSITSTGSTATTTSTGSISLANVSGQAGTAVSGGTGVTLGSATSGAGGVMVSSGTGSINVTTTTAATDASFSAPAGSITTGSITATGGSAALSAQGDIVVGTGTAGSGFSATSAAGDVSATTLSADQVTLAAPGSVTAGTINTGGGSVSLVGDVIAASVNHTGGGILQMSTAGMNGASASSIALNVASPAGTNFSLFSTLDGAVTVTSGWLNIASGIVGNAANFLTPSTDVLVNNVSPAPQSAFDVQLYSPGTAFQLFVSGNFAQVGGSNIIHYSELTHSVFSETTGSDGSLGTVANREGVRVGLGAAPAAEGLPLAEGLVSYTGEPVQMEDLQ